MNKPAKDRSTVDTVFAGAMPEMYETLMVPLIFEPYAIDLVDRLAGRSPRRVLEIAAGTGVVTRRLAALLPAGTTIVATDLNPAMLDHAATLGTAQPVEWRQADAMQLPFADQSFDAVVCQFGVMFFPDKAQGVRRGAARSRAGGVFLFNAWDRIEDNEFADTVTAALATLFPDDPPRFMARTPHGYHDLAAIVARSEAGRLRRHAARLRRSRRAASRASARTAAMAYCLGTPLRNEIEARDPCRPRARLPGDDGCADGALRRRRRRRQDPGARRHGRPAMTARLAAMSRIAGIDVGGTFTDLIVVDDESGEVRIAKVPTTVDNQAFGVLAALDAAGVDPATLAAIVHGTTTTTNAMLERKIATVGLITTRGFRDVLELGRRTRPTPYGLKGRFVPLIERHLRLEVDERIDAEGGVARAARRGAGRGGGRAADRARRRKRRHPLPAQLPQRRRTRRGPPRSCAPSGRTATSPRGTASSPSTASTSAARRRR